MATWPDLTGILAGVPWAVVGAVATRAYMPERSTQDLGILVAVEVAQEVRARLERAQFHRVQELAIGRVTWRSPSGRLVDVIEWRAGWVTEALQRLGPDALEDLESLITLGKLEIGEAPEK